MDQLVDESQVITGWCRSKDGCPPGCIEAPPETDYPIVPPGQFSCILSSAGLWPSGAMYYKNTDWHGIQNGGNGVVNRIVDDDLNTVYEYGDGTVMPGWGTGNKTRIPYVSKDMIIFVGSDVQLGPSPNCLYIVRKNINGIFELQEQYHLKANDVPSPLRTYNQHETVTFKDGIVTVGSAIYFNSTIVWGLLNFNMRGELIDYIVPQGYIFGSYYPLPVVIGERIWIHGAENNYKNAIYNMDGTLFTDLGVYTGLDTNTTFMDLGDYGNKEMVIAWNNWESRNKTKLVIYDYDGNIVKTMTSPLDYKKGYGTGISRCGKFTLIAQGRVSDEATNNYGLAHLYDENLNFMTSYNFIKGQIPTQIFEVYDVILTRKKIWGRDSRHNDGIYQMECDREGQ